MRPEEVAGILSAFHDTVVKGPVRRIVVSRLNVWRSASQFLKLPTVGRRQGKILCKLQGDHHMVEPSADDGGPLREFFRLLLLSVVTHSGAFSTGWLPTINV
mgnify:CR=1 FL=1